MSDATDSTPTLDQSPARWLVRADDGRWLGGVCAGLGRYFDVNPLVYRIGFAALALAGGTGLLLYVAAWLVIPSETSDDSIAVEALRDHRERPWLMLGVGLLAFGAILALSEARFWPSTGNVWLAAILGGGAIVWWHVGRRARGRVAADSSPGAIEASRPPKRPSFVSPVLGALLVVTGVLGLLAVVDVYDVDVAVALAAGVAIVGAAIAVGATTGRRVGGLVFLGLVLLAAFGVAAAIPVDLSSGVGEKVERPRTVTALDESYELGFGALSVDLSRVALRAGTTEVDVKLGVGEVIVTVPEGAALEIDARAGVGEVNVFGERDDGTAAHEQITIAGPTADAPVLKLDADVGLGSIEVRRG